MCAPWLSAIDYVNIDGGIVTGCFGDVKKFLKNGKLEKIVAVIKSCTPNALGDLTVTLKDLSGTISGTIHYKVFTEERFTKAFTVRIRRRNIVCKNGKSDIDLNTCVWGYNGVSGFDGLMTCTLLKQISFWNNKKDHSLAPPAALDYVGTPSPISLPSAFLVSLTALEIW
ncbi:transposase, MuDR, MULE transposase domain protein [Tanacetum coccineum]